MKLVRYASPKPRWGLLSDDGITPLDGPEAGEQAVLELLAGGRLNASWLQLPVPHVGLQLLPPIVGQANVYCIGLNYRSHVAETGHELRAQPTVFLRDTDSLVGDGAAMIRPRVSSQFDFEGELAIVIGRGGRHISEEQVPAHVGALTCFNDGSLRDFQQHSLAAGKNFNRSGACGPWLVLSNEVADFNRLGLCTRLNGNLVQQSNTQMLIHPIAKLVSYLSQIVELRTGDVIATGTPEGVGARRHPPLWLRPGDTIEVAIDGVGVLRNVVQDEP